MVSGMPSNELAKKIQQGSVAEVIKALTHPALTLKDFDDIVDTLLELKENNNPIYLKFLHAALFARSPTEDRMHQLMKQLGYADDEVTIEAKKRFRIWQKISLLEVSHQNSTVQQTPVKERWDLVRRLLTDKDTSGFIKFS
jgi:hypothetical protein